MINPLTIQRRATRSESGAALVIVLWFSFGLVSLALYFGNSMSLELKAAANSEAGIQAELAVDGATRYVKYLLENLEEDGRLPSAEDFVLDDVPVGEATFWIVGRDPSGEITEYPYFNLIDEAGKLNLNTAQFTNLIELPFMTEELAYAIIDWRDTDDEPQENGGAESDTYLRFNPPYTAKNSPFETTDELRLVNGATDAILYGEDANRNGVLDPNEDDGDDTPPTDNSDGTLDLGILEFVTVYSRESTVQTNGDPRITVVAANQGQQGGGNPASQELQDHLTEILGEDRANEVAGRVGNANSVLQFYILSQLTSAEFAQIDDALSMSTNAVEGLINVNTASADVLNTLPGIEWNDAEAMVAYREQNESALNSVAWLTEVLTEQDDKLNAIGPFVTDKGYQYTADISAVGRNGRGYRRSLLVFDISEHRPKVVYRRELSRSGWALGRKLREELFASVQQTQ
ncbi:MAG: type II secretory pathway component PulK [Limisphaerales bacterium]|jgi:type II secretory pathway component PulK